MAGLKRLLRPLVWLLKYLACGLSIVGLGVHARPMPESAGDRVAEVDAPLGSHPERVPPQPALTWDEQLWLAELRESDN